MSYYADLAPHYDCLPHHRAGLVPAVGRAIADALCLEDQDVLVDLCCGTGLFAREIRRRVPLRYPILAVDSSTEMLGQLDSTWNAGIRPIAMDALVFAKFPVSYQKILIKDALVHFSDLGMLFGSLRNRLAQRGRLLVAELAPDSQAPLFTEALRRWEAIQPRPVEIAAAMASARFSVTTCSVQVSQTLGKGDYLSMVARRYVPILSSFDDEELRQGIEEIGQVYAGADEIVVLHRFDLVNGLKS